MHWSGKIIPWPNWQILVSLGGRWGSWQLSISTVCFGRPSGEGWEALMAAAEARPGRSRRLYEEV